MRNEKTLLEIYEPGESITFGSYEGKPIRWKVLAKKGKERLLISEDIVAHQPYHIEYRSMYWQKSSLRKWLNQQFYREAFSFKEQTQILNTRLENQPNPEYAVGNGPNTVDKIFILSWDELQKYFPVEEDRVCDGWWWLRTVGSNDLSACSVYMDGSVYTYGVHVIYADGGVRPVLWMMLRDSNVPE